MNSVKHELFPQSAANFDLGDEVKVLMSLASSQLEDVIKESSWQGGLGLCNSPGHCMLGAVYSSEWPSGKCSLLLRAFRGTWFPRNAAGRDRGLS